MLKGIASLIRVPEIVAPPRWLSGHSTFGRNAAANPGTLSATPFLVRFAVDSAGLYRDDQKINPIPAMNPSRLVLSTFVGELYSRPSHLQPASR